jgi:hypothetical protein
MSTIDERLARFNDLKTQHAKIGDEITVLRKELEGELSVILGAMNSAPDPRKTKGKGSGTKKCSLCGKEGHNTKTCDQKLSALQ